MQIVVLLILGTFPILFWILRAKVPLAKASGVLVVWAAALATTAWIVIQRDESAGDRSASTESVPRVQTAVGGPRIDRSSGFVGSDACRDCHSGQHASWYATYHRTMTQVPSPETVIGDFDDPDLPECGLPFDLRLLRDDEQFFIEMAAEGLGEQRRPVVLTTGSHHMQVYWMSLDESTSALGMLPYAYLRDEARWVPRHAAFLRPPQPVADNELGRWNLVCIQCHTTFGRPGFTHYDDPDHVYFDGVDSRVAELGISCEACHGPGEAHVRFQRRRGGTADSKEDPPLQAASLVNPAELSHRRSSQVCGQCHAVFELTYDGWEQWNAGGHDFRPGADLSESTTRRLITCCDSGSVEPDEAGYAGTADLMSQFWPDGMIRVRGREYTAILNTPCFEKGEMSCVTCHQLHQKADDPRPAREWANDLLKHGLDSGNQACLDCHQDFAEDDVLVNHTHHAADSAGSLCYNCHMPFTTYGLLKAIRSHQIDSPDVATTIETGRPNACNQCHLDRTLSWTAENLSRWYGRPAVELPDEHATTAASVLWLLQGDAGQRALTAWTFGWEDAHAASGTEWLAPHLSQLLVDPYDAVRFIAGKSLGRLEGFEQLEYDYLAPQPELSRHRNHVLQTWAARSERLAPQQAARVLIDGDGALLDDRVRQLLQGRDDREVRLSE
ncbi:MAG: C cytochrome precursor [Planctomycetota bacterium]|nr:MAG: C cytochrome precursor [Planctomycetota bacterium]